MVRLQYASKDNKNHTYFFDVCCLILTHLIERWKIDSVFYLMWQLSRKYLHSMNKIYYSMIAI